VAFERLAQGSLRHREPFNAKFDKESKDFVFKGEEEYKDYSDSSTRWNPSSTRRFMLHRKTH
jgi:hypothetical protein